jgi:hypothetical protein
MVAKVAVAKEFERVEEISEASPIPTLESALNTQCRTGFKGGWLGLGHK